MSTACNLPTELLFLILDRLNCFDRVRFAAICGSWSSANRANPPPSSHLPWLMLPDHRTRRFLSLLSHPYKLESSCHLYLPDIRGLFSIGSSPDGWVASVDHRAELHLFNPLTRARIPIPSIATLADITDLIRDDDGGEVVGYMVVAPRPGELPMFHEASYIRDYFLNKLVLSPSASPDSFTAVLIYGRLAELALARPGAERWTPVEGSRYVQDAIFHEGLLHAVECNGDMVACDLDKQLRMVTKAFRRDGHPHNLHFHAFERCQRYLVECSSEVLLVWRQMNLVRTDAGRKNNRFGMATTKVFLLYKFVEEEMAGGRRWKEVKVTSLGEQALLLGMNQSASFSTSELPALRASCIYFTDDYKDFFVIAPDAVRDVGMLDMEDDSVTPFYPSDSSFNWPPPF